MVLARRDIVSMAPLFNDYSRFGQTSKDFCVQTFFAKSAIETFIAAILPRLARFDVRQLDAVAFHLLLQRPCEQFASFSSAAVVAADRFRHSKACDHLSQRGFDVLML